jgi:hypothetical protein
LAFVSRSWSCRSFSSSLSRSRSLQPPRDAMVAMMDYGKATYELAYALLIVLCLNTEPYLE